MLVAYWLGALIEWVAVETIKIKLLKINIWKVSPVQEGYSVNDGLILVTKYWINERDRELIPINALNYQYRLQEDDFKHKMLETGQHAETQSVLS